MGNPMIDALRGKGNGKKKEPCPHAETRFAIVKRQEVYIEIVKCNQCEAEIAPILEPWEAGDAGEVYHGQPHSYTYQIATFEPDDYSHGDDIGQFNKARALLAAQAPEMAWLLYRLLRGAKKKELMKLIEMTLNSAGVMTRRLPEDALDAKVLRSMKGGKKCKKRK